MGTSTLHVLRVFCAEDGSGGNPLGVFLDGPGIPERRHQAIAHELGFSETVFVEDAGAGTLRIFTPEVELPLAGHPLVGTAWLLREQHAAPVVLRPPAGEVGVRFERELAFVAARPEWAPELDFVELDSPQAVEELDRSPAGHGAVGIWAWIDRSAGSIRERVFAPELGIPEDEATGSAALRLCDRLGRPIQIRQGAGSLIYARPLPDGMAEIGGRVVIDDVREHATGVHRR